MKTFLRNGLSAALTAAVATACQLGADVGADTTTLADTVDAVEAGKQVAAANGCNGCHGSAAGTLAGGKALGLDGKAFASNLTPDLETGVGGWTDSQLIAAVREGLDDEGAELCTSMPRFAQMTDIDAKNLVAYLRSLPAVANEVKESVCPPIKPEPGTDDGTGGTGTGGTGDGTGGTGDGTGGTGDGTGGTGDGTGGTGTGGTGTGDGTGGTDDGGTGGTGGTGTGGSTDICEVQHLLLSRIKTRGMFGGNDEYVEIFNPTSSPVVLDKSWALWARSLESAGFSSRWRGGGFLPYPEIPSGGTYLLTGRDYIGAWFANDSLSTGIRDAGALILTKNASGVSSPSTPTTDDIVVDAVCFAFDAAAAFDPSFLCEGAPVSNLPHDNSPSSESNSENALVRQSRGGVDYCADTGDSKTDFVSERFVFPTSVP